MVTIRQTEKGDTHQSFTPKQNHKLAASMNHCGIASEFPPSWHILQTKLALKNPSLAAVMILISSAQMPSKNTFGYP